MRLRCSLSEYEYWSGLGLPCCCNLSASQARDVRRDKFIPSAMVGGGPCTLSSTLTDNWQCRDTYQLGELLGGRRGYTKLGGRTIVRDDLVLVFPITAFAMPFTISFSKCREVHRLNQKSLNFCSRYGKLACNLFGNYQALGTFSGNIFSELSLQSTFQTSLPGGMSIRLQDLLPEICILLGTSTRQQVDCEDWPGASHLLCPAGEQEGPQAPVQPLQASRHHS